METKEEYIKKLWSFKSPAEIVLVMYQLIENSKWSQLEKDKTYAVLKGIVTYLIEVMSCWNTMEDIYEMSGNLFGWNKKMIR